MSLITSIGESGCTVRVCDDIAVALADRDLLLFRNQFIRRKGEFPCERTQQQWWMRCYERHTRTPRIAVDLDEIRRQTALLEKAIDGGYR